jgi:hypothetical protein
MTVIRAKLSALKEGRWYEYVIRLCWEAPRPS